jgi:hypothetical protein
LSFFTSQYLNTFEYELFKGTLLVTFISARILQVSIAGITPYTGSLAALYTLETAALIVWLLTTSRAATPKFPTSNLADFNVLT